MAANRRRSAEGWQEKQCTKCGEWWPDDKEFFYKAGGGNPRKLMDVCKDCYTSRRRAAGTKPPSRRMENALAKK
jgi:hypothetical protein